MNSNFKVGILALVFAAAAGLAVASVDKGTCNAGRAHRGQAFQKAKMSVVADRLGLTPEQRTKLKEMRKQTAASIQAIRENATLTPEQKHTQIAAVRQTSREQWKSVLTDEQKGKLAQVMSHPRQLDWLAARRVKMAAVANQLGLSPEQRTKIHEIAKKTADAVKPLRADKTLSPEARREKVRQARQEGRKEILGVLTPEQSKELNKMRHRMLAPLGPLG